MNMIFIALNETTNAARVSMRRWPHFAGLNALCRRPPRSQSQTRTQRFRSAAGMSRPIPSPVPVKRTGLARSPAKFNSRRGSADREARWRRQDSSPGSRAYSVEAVSKSGVRCLRVSVESGRGSSPGTLVTRIRRLPAGRSSVACREFAGVWHHRDTTRGSDRCRGVRRGVCPPPPPAGPPRYPTGDQLPGPPCFCASPQRAGGSRSRVVFGVRIERPPDHPLILRVVLARLVLEELDAARAQCDRDLDAFVPKDQALGARKEVRNDLQPSQTLVRVSDVLAHFGRREREVNRADAPPGRSRGARPPDPPDVGI